MTTILGVESTAHTFGIGIVKDGKVIANEKDSYTTEKGGIIPLEAAKHHEQVKEKILKQALDKAKISMNDIDYIAFSQGPGIAPSLLVGLKFVKHLAKTYNKEIIPVNHCIAHLEIGQSVGAKDPVLLYTSGANTQIIAYASGKYRIFGETLDLGIGNVLDTFARYAGMGFPGGPKIAQLVENSKDHSYIELPYSIKGMDVAFSGILTNLRNKLNKFKIEDLAYSLQETAFSMLVEAAERAMAHTGKNELVLGGGVACNKRIQEMCKIMCEERGAKSFCPENSLLVDNGAMIAFTGWLIYKHLKHNIDIEKLDIKPRERTDDVNVYWR